MKLSPREALCLIVFLGVGGQWIAWRLKLPSILILLIFGILSGPVFQIIDTNTLFGPLLLPLVSVLVSIILFEGGLSLRLVELKAVGRAFVGLATFGVGITFLASAYGAKLILGFEPTLALLFGAILVVTGPTVIGPLLQHARPSGKVASILRWEGIGLDPLGAVLALAVYEVAVTPASHNGTYLGITSILFALAVGTLVAGAAAASFMYAMKRSLIPEHLQSPVTLLFVLLSFGGADYIGGESGLFAVTLLGIILSNQKSFDLQQIQRFKEPLTVLLISILFITLGARLSIEDIYGIEWSHLYFVLYLICVVRPLAVFVSTVGANLTWNERLYLAFFAPRGIVAAAVTSVFALELERAGFVGAGRIVPAMFVVIVSTVTVYGLLARPFAKYLRLVKVDPQGILFVGSTPMVRKIAKAVQAEGIAVLLVDSTWSNISASRLEGLPSHYGSILSSNLIEEINLGDLGKLLAMTPNSELNALACVKFKQLFSPENVYQLPFEQHQRVGHRKEVAVEQRGSYLFGDLAALPVLEREFGVDATIKTTKFTKEFDYAAFNTLYGQRALPLFILKEPGVIRPILAGETLAPLEGESLLSIVRNEATQGSESETGT